MSRKQLLPGIPLTQKSWSQSFSPRVCQIRMCGVAIAPRVPRPEQIRVCGVAIPPRVPSPSQIEVRKSAIPLYHMLVDTTTDATLASGGVGFWTGTTDAAVYDNVVVRPI